jgi:molybdate transport system substrate-binding protein
MKLTRASSRRSGRTNPLWVLLLGAVGGVIVLSAVLLRIAEPVAPEKRPLRLYCAAGMRVPVDQIVEQYEAEYGVPVEIQYGGSNTLLSQLEVNRSSDADLFLAADDFYTQLAVERGLAREVLPVAYTVPVVVIAKGNPKGIHALADLLRKDVKVSLADPDQAAIGKAVRDRLSGKEEPGVRSQESGGGRPSNDVTGPTAVLWSQLQAHVTRNGVFKPTVNDVANDVKLGAVDAGIVWDSTVALPAYKAALEPLEFPELSGKPDLLSLAVLKSSSQRQGALRFARYLTARDKGLKVFAATGMRPVEGDVWAERPEITFFCGAVNRRVVDQIVQDFMRDEGVIVKANYDGCGILTSRMRVIDGQRPDLGFPDVYMACDRYYLDGIADVRGWFEQAAYVSEADLVLAVPKGSDRVKSLADLVKPGVRVAIGEPSQCTIGVLSWNLLRSAGLAEQLEAKQRDPAEVVVTKSSSAHLVPDVVTGHVDAVIAYVTDTLTNRNDIDVIPINLPESVAIQPLTIAHTSEHKYLARRLFQRIAESKEAFEAAGFRYRGLGTKSPGTIELPRGSDGTSQRREESGEWRNTGGEGQAALSAQPSTLNSRSPGDAP